MGHDRRAPFPMAAGIFTILAAILLFSGCGRKENKEDDVVFYLNEEPVRKAEYEMLAKKTAIRFLEITVRKRSIRKISGQPNEMERFLTNC